MTEQRPIGKLPVDEAMKHALTGLFGNLPSLIKIAWPWLLLVGVLSYVVTMQFADWIVQAGTQQPTAGMPMHITVLNGLLQVFALLAGAVMAVGWHRLALLGERATFASALPGWTVLRYIGALLLLVLAIVLPVVLLIGVMVGLFAPGAHQVGGMFMAGLVIALLLAMVATVVVGLRTSMVLPARSIGNNALRLRDSWAATRGNTLRLLLGTLLTFVVPLVVLQLVFMPLLTGHAPVKPADPASVAASIKAFAIPAALVTVMTMMVSMMFVSFLSSAYRHFFGDPLAR